MNLFRTGDLTLSNGGKSTWKIDCDALTDEDIKTLAILAASLCGPFSRVVGVPRGGIRLADALRPYVTTGPLLIVDDVLTTGQSMEEMRKNLIDWETLDDPLPRWGEEPWIRGVVIFSRGLGLSWVTSLFRVHQRLFDV